MISRYFIDRPIFAAVMSIFITLTGGIALLSLPIAQFPPVTQRLASESTPEARHSQGTRVAQSESLAH